VGNCKHGRTLTNKLAGPCSRLHRILRPNLTTSVLPFAASPRTVDSLCRTRPSGWLHPLVTDALDGVSESAPSSVDKPCQPTSQDDLHNKLTSVRYLISSKSVTPGVVLLQLLERQALQQARVKGCAPACYRSLGLTKPVSATGTESLLRARINSIVTHPTPVPIHEVPRQQLRLPRRLALPPTQLAVSSLEDHRNR